MIIVFENLTICLRGKLEGPVEIPDIYYYDILLENPDNRLRVLIGDWKSRRDVTKAEKIAVFHRC